MLKNLIYLYGAHIGRYLLPLLLLPYLARVLGPDKWGLILFFQAMAMYLSLLLEFGFGLSATKEVSQNREDRVKVSESFFSVITIQSAMLILIAILGLVLYQLNEKFYSNPEMYISALAMGVTQGLNLLWFYRGLEQMKLVAILDISAKVIATILILVFLSSGGEAWLVLGSYAVANFMSLLASIVIAKKKIIFAKVGFRRVIAVAQNSFYMFLARAGGLIFSQGSVFIVGLYYEPVIIATYAGAERIITAIRSFSTPAVDALFPRIVHDTHHDTESRDRLLSSALKYFSLGGAAMSLITFLAAPLIVAILLGPDYKDSVVVLRVFSLLPLIIALSHIYGSQCLIPNGHYKPFAYTILIGGLINVVSIIIMATRGESVLWIAAINVVIQAIILLSLYLFTKKYKLTINLK